MQLLAYVSESNNVELNERIIIIAAILSQPHRLPLTKMNQTQRCERKTMFIISLLGENASTQRAIWSYPNSSGNNFDFDGVNGICCMNCNCEYVFQL